MYIYYMKWVFFLRFSLSYAFLLDLFIYAVNDMKWVCGHSVFLLSRIDSSYNNLNNSNKRQQQTTKAATLNIEFQIFI